MTAKQVIADHYPRDLDGIRCLGNRIEKEDAHCQKNTGAQDPRAGFPLAGFRPVDDSADQQSYNAADNLGNQDTPRN